MSHRTTTVVFRLRSSSGDPPAYDPDDLRAQQEADRLEGRHFIRTRREVSYSHLPGPRWPSADVAPLVTSVGADVLVKFFLEVDGARPGREWPAIERYFWTEMPSREDAEALVGMLRAWVRCDLAYIKRPAGPAAAFDDPESANPLDHLRAWPVGVGAECVVGSDGVEVIEGAAGAGVTIAAMEFGWRSSEDRPVDYTGNHDLEGADLSVIFGTPFSSAANHGTRVLGVLVAQADGTGARGLAPASAVQLLAASEVLYLAKNGTTELNSFAALIPQVPRPDVLLLAVQLDPMGVCWPIECEKPNRDMIDALVTDGIVIVEASGDADGDLAELETDTEVYLSTPEAGQFTDPAKRSGALMVAGGLRDEVGWRHDHSSKHGARIDCFCPAKDVFTDYYGKERGRVVPKAAAGFGETSAAAAILAGIIASLQGMARASLGRALTPAEVEVLLRKWGRRAMGCSVGGLPDLERLAARITRPEAKEKYAVGATPEHGLILDRARLAFGFNAWSVTSDHEPALDQIARIMSDHEDILLVQVQGHADIVGTPDDNQTVSERRIEAVIEALVARGVSEARLTPEPFGERMPITTITTIDGNSEADFEAAKALNRRVEFEVVRWQST